MRCVQILKNGRPCGNWALKGTDLCLMHSETPEAKAAASAAKAKLRVGGPRREEMPPPEVGALVAEISAIESLLRPALTDADGQALPENKELVADYAEVRLEIKELRKVKPLTQHRRRELDAAIKRRDAYRDALGLGGPASWERFDSLEAQQKQARAMQGRRPLRTEERAMAVAILLRDSFALPTPPAVGDQPDTSSPPLTAVPHNGGTP